VEEGGEGGEINILWQALKTVIWDPVQVHVDFKTFGTITGNEEHSTEHEHGAHGAWSR